MQTDESFRTHSRYGTSQLCANCYRSLFECQCPRPIQSSSGGGGAEHGDGNGESKNGACSPTDPKLSDGGAWRGSCVVERSEGIQATEKGGSQ
jgi:hypothetical protein